MKTLFLALFTSLCIALPVMGQNYAYHDNPSPTGGSANTFPFGNAFGNNWRYHMSVPASSLPNKPVRFTEFAFAPTASGTFSVKDFQLRMAHASSTVLTSIFATNLGPSPVAMIDVQNGNYTFQATANQWTPLGVQTPFDYDGQRALVIEIRYRGFGTMNQGTASLRGYVSSANSNRVWANGSYPSPGPADPYASPYGWTPYTSGAIRVRLTYEETVITLSGTSGPGGTVDLNLLSPVDAGRFYQAASSLGTGPIPLGNRVLNLSADDLLVITVGGYLPTVFVNYVGKLDAGGKGKAQINIPNDARLKGVRIHSAFITYDAAAPLGIANISNTATFSIT